MTSANEPKKLQTNLFQPQLHQPTEASAKITVGLYVIITIIGTPVYDKNHTLTTSTPAMHGDCTMGKSCASDPRIAGSNPLIGHPFFFESYFHNVFQFFQKSMLTFQSRSHAPHQSFHAQTVVLLLPTSFP